MSQSAYSVTNRWVSAMRGAPDRRTLRPARVNVFADGNALYSYGYHFTLARALRSKRGELTGFLLNGDRYSNTTTRHQSYVRGAVSDAGVPSCIIPFQALSAAGIDTDTVEILESLPDRSETRHHSSAELPEGATCVTVPVWGDVPMTADEIGAILDARYAEAHTEWTRKRAARDAAAERLESRTSRFVATDTADAARDIGPEPMRDTFTVESLATSDPWGGHTHITWPGRIFDPLPAGRARVIDGVPHKRERTGTRTLAGFGMRRTRHTYGPEDHGVRFSGPELTRDDTAGVWRWSTYRHWLGESLIRATVHTRVVRTCRACKDFGRGIGPAVQRTRVGWRQGETFLVHPECPECDGRGSHTRYVTRRALFLSGFDHNERRPCYFLCELPRSARNVRTVAEAYESLKPEAVRVAESVGRDVRRQGDVFAIPVSVTTRELTRQGGKRERGAYVLGTNHRVTESVVLDGVTYARGTLTHDPRGRRPDHARLTLPRGTWHVLVKNTVPIGA